MKLTEKAQEVLASVVASFEDGTVAAPLALMLLPPLDVPAAGWSRLNRFLISLAGTGDARGLKQWNQVGRKVRKGGKAIHILVPMMSNNKGSSLPGALEIVDFPRLWKKLHEARDPLSQYIREQLSPKVKKLLCVPDGYCQVLSDFRRDLNALLARPLFNKHRFSQVTLPLRIYRLIKQDPTGKALVELNLQLLEEAYPREIGKRRKEGYLLGFKAIPVFRIEDTEGKPVFHRPLQPATPPPLIEVAEALGISVQYQALLFGLYGGYTEHRIR